MFTMRLVRVFDTSDIDRQLCGVFARLRTCALTILMLLWRHEMGHSISEVFSMTFATEPIVHKWMRIARDSLDEVIVDTLDEREKNGCG